MSKSSSNSEHEEWLNSEPKDWRKQQSEWLKQRSIEHELERLRIGTLINIKHKIKGVYYLVYFSLFSTWLAIGYYFVAA